MWVVLIYNLAGQPVYADRYYQTRETCMMMAQYWINNTRDVSRVRCVDPGHYGEKTDPSLKLEKSK